MNDSQVQSLQEKALALLRKRRNVEDITTVHMSQDLVPSTKSRVFKIVAAKSATPNDPQYEIVVDEKGKAVDLEALCKKENVAILAPREFHVDFEVLLTMTSEENVTINPSSNNRTLNPEESQEEIITVTIPKSASVQKADIYFLADTTGSMGTVLNEIKSSSSAILTALNGQGIDVAFGVGNYKDFPIGQLNTYAFEHQLSPTTDTVAVQAAIDSWSATGGRDTPEGQLFALDKIAEDRDSEIGWRFDAKRIIIWFGDQPGHEPICQSISALAYDITKASVIRKLILQDITVFPISTTTGAGLDADPTIGATDYQVCGTPAGSAMQATDIAESTNGVHLTDVEPTAIVNEIITVLRTVASTINEVRLDPDDQASVFISSISNAEKNDDLSNDEVEVFEFRVTFRGGIPCADEEQVFNGIITVRVDGDVRAFKSLRVTVPACPSDPDPQPDPQPDPPVLIEIVGFPSVISFRPVNRNDRQLYVFVRGNDGNLHTCFFDNANSQWRWRSLGSPARLRRVNSSPSAVVQPIIGLVGREVHSGFHEDAHIFVRGNNGHIFECVWSGHFNDNPIWHDLGQPSSNTDTTFHPSSVRIIPQTGDAGIVGEGWLHTYTWASDGLMWFHNRTFSRWRSFGILGGDHELAGDPGVITRIHESWAFVVTTANELFLKRMYNANPYFPFYPWQNLEMPSQLRNQGGLYWLRRPALVFDQTRTGNQPSAFVVGDGRLWELSFRQNRPIWNTIGQPANVDLWSSASAVTYTHDFNKPYIFDIGSNGRLYSTSLSRTNPTRQWFFHDHHQEDGLAILRSTFNDRPAAIVHNHQGEDWLYAFAISRSGNLVVVFWDKSSWRIRDLGRPEAV